MFFFFILPEICIKNTMENYKLEIAQLLIRLFAGSLFVFQGYDKLFRIKMPGVIDAFIDDAAEFHIPRSLITLMAYYTSIVEFIGGIFLIFGFFTTYTLCAIGLDLVLVTVAFSYLNPMWEMKHVFPRFLLVILLLVIPVENNPASLDFIMKLKSIN